MPFFFADTFFWVALSNFCDSSHERAKAFVRSTSPRIVTTEEVLTEYLNYLAERGPTLRSRVAANVEQMLIGASVDVIPQSGQSFRAGLRLFSARSDKGFSLTDCISMQTMRTLGLADVLTNDHHFEQEGFRILF